MKHIKLYNKYVENEIRIEALYQECIKYKNVIITKFGINDYSKNLLKTMFVYKELQELESKQEKLCNKIRKTKHYINNSKIGDHLPTFIKNSLK